MFTSIGSENIKPYISLLRSLLVMSTSAVTVVVPRFIITFFSIMPCISYNTNLIHHGTIATVYGNNSVGIVSQNEKKELTHACGRQT